MCKGGSLLRILRITNIVCIHVYFFILLVLLGVAEYDFYDQPSSTIRRWIGQILRGRRFRSGGVVSYRMEEDWIPYGPVVGVRIDVWMGAQFRSSVFFRCHEDYGFFVSPTSFASICTFSFSLSFSVLQNLT